MDRQIDPVQETLYNVRNRVPNWLDIFQDWHDRAAAFRQRATAKLDIRYGDSPLSTLDLFLPQTQDDQPVALHIFIHGGYWQAMDKSDFSFVAENFVQNGVAVAIVNYDLCPNVALDHIVDQMRDVINWAWGQGEHYGIDPHNIHISGHSAGGHLVAALLTTDWKACGTRHVHDSVIKSAISLSGLVSLHPLINTTINANVGLTPESASALSPYGQTAHVHCPTFWVYGGAEGDGFEMQSQKAQEHFQAQGLPAEILKLENATHFDVVEALTDQHSPVFQWALKHATE